MNQSFDQVLENSEKSFANDMIGKVVSFIDMEANNAEGLPGVARTGLVTQMDIFGDMERLKIAEVDPISLITTEHTINAEEVTSILNPFGS